MDAARRVGGQALWRGRSAKPHQTAPPRSLSPFASVLSRRLRRRDGAGRPVRFPGRRRAEPSGACAGGRPASRIARGGRKDGGPMNRRVQPCPPWRAAVEAVRRGTVAGLVFLVRVYQRAVSPLLGSRCRYAPTCSEYAVEALERHGAVRGLALTLWRVLRCHPFGGSGRDPVPPPRPAAEARSGPGAGA